MKIDDLKSRLTNEFPSIYNTILIDGNWGIGKTYFIKNDFLKYKKPMYISLFGINSFEEFKAQLYMELNKVLGFLNKTNKEIEGMSIGLLGFSLSIPYFEKNIIKKIKKRSDKEDIIIIIDDIERKNNNINIEAILGLIESISNFEKVNIILIANEKEIPEKDLEKYKIFKEKVIQKTYFIDKYSDSAVKKIINNLNLNNFNDTSKVSFKSRVKTFLQKHRITNLRTIEKGVKFVNFIFNKINIKTLTEDELYDISTMALAIVLEKIEYLYSKDIQENNDITKGKLSYEELIIEKHGKLAYCITKNYFGESFSSIRYNIINPLLEIYEDKNIEDNVNKIDKYYVYKKESEKTENKISQENMFYLSEENQREIILDFYNNSVLKANPNLDINSWFKNFDNIYTNASRIDMQDIFNEEKVISAMDLYLENLIVKDSLLYVLHAHVPFEFKNDKMKEYNKILNDKITNKYYEKYLKLVKEDVEHNKYDIENLQILFSLYRENNFTQKGILIEEIEKNNYFIPNLNGDISEKSWGFAHKIWNEMEYLTDKRDNKFEIHIKKVLENENTTKVGKYRITSLNSQYHINIEKNNNTDK